MLATSCLEKKKNRSGKREGAKERHTLLLKHHQTGTKQNRLERQHTDQNDRPHRQQQVAVRTVVAPSAAYYYHGGGTAAAAAALAAAFATAARTATASTSGVTTTTAAAAWARIPELERQVGVDVIVEGEIVYR